MRAHLNVVFGIKNSSFLAQIITFKKALEYLNDRSKNAWVAYGKRTNAYTN